MSVIDPLDLLVELHIQLGIAGVQTCGDSIGHFTYVTVERTVFDTQFVGVAEREKWTELQLGVRVSLDKSIFYQDAVLVRYKYFLFGQNNTAHTECHRGYSFTVKFTYVFVSVGRENISLILVQSEIEGRTVLYHGFIKI